MQTLRKGAVNADMFRPDGSLRPYEEQLATRERAELVARWYDFAFYFWGGDRYEYRGWKSEERPATEEEQKMWKVIDGYAPDTDWLKANPEAREGK